MSCLSRHLSGRAGWFYGRHGDNSPLAGCGKTSISTASAKTISVTKPKDGGLLPRHPLPGNRTASVTRRPGDSPAPNVSSVGSHPQLLPAPRTQARAEYAPNSLSSAAQRCRVLGNDSACAPPAGRRTPLSTASRWRFFAPIPDR